MEHTIQLKPASHDSSPQHDKYKDSGIPIRKRERFLKSERPSPLNSAVEQATSNTFVIQGYKVESLLPQTIQSESDVVHDEKKCMELLIIGGAKAVELPSIIVESCKTISEKETLSHSDDNMDVEENLQVTAIQEEDNKEESDTKIRRRRKNKKKTSDTKSKPTTNTPVRVTRGMNAKKEYKEDIKSEGQPATTRMKLGANKKSGVSKPGRRKSHSSSGTTCHQCKQKTLSTKTTCRFCYQRSGSTDSSHWTDCSSAYCETCLCNRYGIIIDLETESLPDTWKCPMCEGICNCSACRRKHKQGNASSSKYAKNLGYSSVHEMLLDK
jgi:hypothetical protein